MDLPGQAFRGPERRGLALLRRLEEPLPLLLDAEEVAGLMGAPCMIPNEFRPTFFVDLTPADFEAKQRALREHASRREKSFMDSERVLQIAQSWSAFLNASSRLFEAFQIYKSFWS